MRETSSRAGKFLVLTFIHEEPPSHSQQFTRRFKLRSDIDASEVRQLFDGLSTHIDDEIKRIREQK